jgi:hypothetical protein
MRILAATYGQTPSIDEYRILYEAWGFSVEDVDWSDPCVAWRRGPSCPARACAAGIERARSGTLTVIPGAGHYLDSVHHPEMLKFLTGWR